jgi:hypothetical protein
MSWSLIIEEERGTFRGHAHPHNGYYAGDFSIAVSAPSAPAAVRTPAHPVDSRWTATVRSFDRTTDFTLQETP